MKRNFTFVCDSCEVAKDELVDETEEKNVRCDECGKVMRKTFGGCGKFAMKGKFTAKNGYGLKG